MFYVTATKPVNHNDREIEIIALKRDMQQWCEENFGSKTPELCHGQSCEQMANTLMEQFELETCSLLEDNENGAFVQRSPFVVASESRTRVGGEAPKPQWVQDDELREIPRNERLFPVFMGVECEGPLASDETPTLFIACDTDYPVGLYSSLPMRHAAGYFPHLYLGALDTHEEVTPMILHQFTNLVKEVSDEDEPSLYCVTVEMSPKIMTHHPQDVLKSLQTLSEETALIVVLRIDSLEDFKSPLINPKEFDQEYGKIAIYYKWVGEGRIMWSLVDYVGNDFGSGRSLHETSTDHPKFNTDTPLSAIQKKFNNHRISSKEATHNFLQISEEVEKFFKRIKWSM